DKTRGSRGWPPSAPLVAPHELRLGEDVSLHGLPDLVLSGAGSDRERSVERVELEEVAMRGSAGRRGAAVPKLAEVVLAIGAPLSTASGSPLRSGGIPTSTQCTQVPTGASGSSTIRTKLFVCAGAPVQSSAGERSGPSAVNRAGIASPLANAGLVIASAAIGS